MRTSRAGIGGKKTRRLRNELEIQNPKAEGNPKSEGQPLAANRFDRKYLEVLEVQRV